MRYFSICAQHKCESPWLREWIEYHRLVGAEHFWLYNDNHDGPDAPATAQVLAPYIAAGIVEDFPALLPMQIDHYHDAMVKAAGKTRWLAVIDVDEFIRPMKTDSVSELLQDYESYGGLVANWLCFGSSGYNEQLPPSQIRNLIWRAPEHFQENNHIKSIVDPAQVLHFHNPHNCTLVSGYSVDENFKFVNDAHNGRTFNHIAINHYFCRAKQWYYEVKQNRGSASKRGKRPLHQLNSLWKNMDKYDVCDTDLAVRFGNRLGDVPITSDVSAIAPPSSFYFMKPE